MNRKLIKLTAAILLIFVLAACGNDSENGNVNQEATDSPEKYSTTEAENDPIDDSEKSTVDQEDEHRDTNMGDGSRTGADRTVTTNGDNGTLEADYPFVSFDLEADFEGTEDAVDVDYEMDGENTEASYVDKLQGIQLSGNDAMEELDSIFSSFAFDKDSSEEEVMNAVVDAFNIPQDADKVELEIEFMGGTEREYNK
ncbi:YusW family protein [Oceanobacillus damuensis]|uniref:YusW family protein n=1 Tax=Oceanobacillus damuensis TaxID=937928 RepID=UPI00082CC488|nr:YusW family protein [Oceanobacillus damuensis]